MVISPDFWKGRRVLVTGHTGFKGSWLSLWLQKLGAKVSGFALAPSTTPSMFELAEVASGMVSFEGDIRNYVELADVLQQSHPEIVFHLAAQALVRQSYVDPIETYSTNVLGTVHVLEAARQVRDVRAIINVTSDKCYENREWPWGYRENDRLGGFDPYSNSKACAELVSSAYQSSYLHAPNDSVYALATARAGNVIGGGDWADDRLIPDAIRAFLSGQPIKIRNSAAVRPWQHVLDPLGGYLLLAEQLFAEPEKYWGPWNFGPSDSDARDVSWLISEFATRWGRNARWEQDPGAHPHETGILRLDCSKARSKLGWRQRLDLNAAIDWTVEWYQRYADAAAGGMREISQTQIERFMAIPTRQVS